jgi:opacity protein-like surface antigen
MMGEFFRKRELVVCAVVWFVSSAAQAEPVEDAPRRFGFGGKVGLNAATYGGEDADREFVESTNTLGFAVGGFATVNAHEIITLQPEIVFITKGTDADVDGEYGGGFNLRYIEIPVLARIRIPVGERIHPYVTAGPQVSFLVKSEVEERDGRTTDVVDDTQSIDVGVVLGAGATIKIPSLAGAVLVEARYDWGLRKIYPESPLEVQTRTLSFLIGYQY